MLGWNATGVIGEAVDAATLLRARDGLNTPDALQAACALVASERPVFVTADVGFAKVSGLEVRLITVR